MEKIDIKALKNKVLRDLNIVLSNYQDILDDEYAEEEFRSKKYGAWTGQW